MSYERRVVNSLNFDPNNYPGEINNLPTETVPDQSMSIKEILARFARGLSIDNAKVPIYDEQEDGTIVDPGRDPKTMDISEIHEEIEDIKYRDYHTKQKQQRNAKNKTTTLPDGNQTKIRTGTADTGEIHSSAGGSDDSGTI